MSQFMYSRLAEAFLNDDNDEALAEKKMVRLLALVAHLDQEARALDPDGMEYQVHIALIQGLIAQIRSEEINETADKE